MKLFAKSLIINIVMCSAVYGCPAINPGELTTIVNAYAIPTPDQNFENSLHQQYHFTPLNNDVNITQLAIPRGKLNEIKQAFQTPNVHIAAVSNPLQPIIIHPEINPFTDGHHCAYRVTLSDGNQDVTVNLMLYAQ